jgi:D-3-phosphoglycerate dehydrogenase / 2-oxoglutarate reductase
MRVLLLETIAPEALDLLLKAEIEVCENYETEINPAFDLTKIDGIITRGIGKVTQSLIEKCTNLKTIARCGIGLNNIDVVFASTKNIRVLNAPGSNAQTVAEHTLALMLTSVRNLHNSINATKTDNWPYRNTYKGDELSGKKIGILGLGNIGLRVAKLAEAFGMEVSYWSKTKKESTFRYQDFESIISTSDVLSIHLELNAETQNLLSENAQKTLKNGVTIINTARAELIDNKALLENLKTGKVGNFAADVPMPNEAEDFKKLLSHPNTYITPHTSSLTTHTYTLMCTEVIENVILELYGKGAKVGNIANRLDIKE